MSSEERPPESSDEAAARRLELDIAEMLGLAKGILADGVVTEGEAVMLQSWMEAHGEVVGDWPGSVISQRLRQVFEDGVVTPEESQDLAELLEQLLGGKIGIMRGGATALPLDDPLPAVEVSGRTFVLAGRFAYGPRGACEDAIVQAGGRCELEMDGEPDYFVIGTFGARDWIRSDWARKVARAVDLRRRHGKPFIIGENHWAAALSRR